MKTIHERIIAKITAAPGKTMIGVIRFPFAAVGCWEWQGAYSTKRGGHRRPNIQIDPRTHANPFRVLLCYRTETTLHSQRDLHAAHNAGCDNSRCVNPFHGHWATHADNQAERAQRHPDSYLRKDKRP